MSAHLPRVTVLLQVTSPEREWLHVGIGYPWMRSWKVLDFAWHHFLRGENNTEGWTHFPVAIDPAEVPVFASLAELVLNNNRHTIPYGLGTGIAFREEEKIFLGESTLGCTCSSFANALLERAGLKHVDVSTWPPRDSDKPWMKQIAEQMRSGPPNRQPSPEHISKFEEQTGEPRLRSEELAAAVQLANKYGRAVRSFNEVEPVGDGIRHVMLDHAREAAGP